jgi:hypothetical protein
MLVNATPLAVLDVPILDHIGREVVVVVVKGTVRVVGPDRVVPHEKPAPIRAKDDLRDEQNPRSSVRYPSDVCIEKHGTDVVVVGEALAPKPVMAKDIAIQVRDSVLPIRVHGPREYFRGILEVAVSAAVPSERIPLIWEKAYGGAYDDSSFVELRNPAGVGVARDHGLLVGTSAPQLEHPALPYRTSKDKHPPVGCGATLPHWSPRREYAGTFDDLWRATRMPLMPRDFDVRHNNVAAPGLIFSPALVAGDAVSVLGMSLPELFSFRVPRMPVVFVARYDDETKELRPAIDTVLVEPAHARVEVVLRAAFETGRGASSLREIRVKLDD